MCTPALAVTGLGVAFSAAGQVMAGNAEAKSYKAQAKQYEIRRIEAATEASQAARDRFDEFAEADAVNQTLMAASGLTMDSFAALREGNRLTAQEDMTRIEDGQKIEDGRLRFAASDARASARIAKSGGLLNGLATGLMGAGDIAFKAGKIS